MRTSLVQLSKVAVLGAAGGIGQPLSLLLKQSKRVNELRLYDVKGAVGVAADLSHICSPAKTTGYAAEDIAKALDGADVVIIPAGVPRKPGMTRDDLFNTNASIVQTLAESIAKHAPNAIIGVISNPVNSTVPIAANALKSAGVFNPKKLFGVTTLDSVRARTFVGEALKKSPLDMHVRVIGGHSGETIVPLLSQYSELSEEQVQQLTHRIQFGGDEVVKAKAGAGSATLSMAFAGYEFASDILRALDGEKGIIMCSFVQSSVQPTCEFFSSPVELGKGGVEKILPMPKLNKFEEGLLEKCLKTLSTNIAKGLKFTSK